MLYLLSIYAAVALVVVAAASVLGDLRQADPGGVITLLAGVLWPVMGVGLLQLAVIVLAAGIAARPMGLTLGSGRTAAAGEFRCPR